MNLRERNKDKKYFCINVNKYSSAMSFEVYRPASLNNPKSEAVMFILEDYMSQRDVFLLVERCLIFWPENVEVPEEIAEKHCIVRSNNPHLDYCRFYQDNDITYLPAKEQVQDVDGAWIAETAQIGEGATIMPGAYIGGEVVIGKNVYIGCGTKIVGDVFIGNGVIIRENSVIGADGLSTDRDLNGKAVTMPQFGGVILGDGVQVGANTVIARGAIDDTIIECGSKIDNSCFISHNVNIGEDSFIVGETILFGSSSLGKGAYVSGNATVRNGVHIGNNALVGMGAVVVKNVEDNIIVKGNPAK